MHPAKNGGITHLGALDVGGPLASLPVGALAAQNLVRV